MARNWQDVFQDGQGFSKRTISQLAGIEVDLATALAFVNGGSLPATLPSDARLRKLIDAFTPLTAEIGIQCHSNGNDFSLYYGFGGIRYWRQVLRYANWTPGGYSLHQLQSASEAVPMVPVLGNDASVTRGTGVSQLTQAAAFGGQYWYGLTSAQTFTFTTPASTTRIGVRGPKAANGGLARVSIDGDYTKANLLPTAQSMVDSGAYPNTILVANSGPCAPTDRVLDSYWAHTFPTNGYPYDISTAIADENGITAGAHTVVLTPVAVNRTVGGGARVYFAGYGSATATLVPTTPNAYFFDTFGLNSNQDSAWEYAVQSNFVGHGGDTFFGSVHGYESEDSWAVTVDGAAVTMAAKDVYRANAQVQITRTSHLISPADSSTLATSVTVYTLDVNGLSVQNTITWLQTITLDAAYVMCPMNGVGFTKNGNGTDVIFDHMNQLGLGQGPITLPGTSDLYYGNVETQACWTYGGNYGVLMWLPNVTQWTNNWLKSGGSGSLGKYWAVEDRSGGSSSYYTKQYLARVFNAGGLSETVAPGTVWQSQSYYLVGRFPGGAVATLG